MGAGGGPRHSQECRHSTMVVASMKYPPHRAHIRWGLSSVIFILVVLCILEQRRGGILPAGKSPKQPLGARPGPAGPPSASEGQIQPGGAGGAPTPHPTALGGRSSPHAQPHAAPTQLRWMRVRISWSPRGSCLQLPGLCTHTHTRAHAHTHRHERILGEFGENGISSHRLVVSIETPGDWGRPPARGQERTRAPGGG